MQYKGQEIEDSNLEREIQSPKGFLLPFENTSNIIFEIKGTSEPFVEILIEYKSEATVDKRLKELNWKLKKKEINPSEIEKNIELKEALGMIGKSSRKLSFFLFLILQLAQ